MNPTNLLQQNIPSANFWSLYKQKPKTFCTSPIANKEKQDGDKSHNVKSRKTLQIPVRATKSKMTFGHYFEILASQNAKVFQILNSRKKLNY